MIYVKTIILTLIRDDKDPLGTSLLRMCGKCSCFCRCIGGDDDDGDTSGDDVIGDIGKKPKSLFGRFGGVSDGSGCKGADSVVVDVAVVEFDINERGGVDDALN